MGYNTVDMYVAWRNHEPVEGQFDWNSFDIKRFLSLCHKHGLWVYFRIGPYITNEQDGGGLPQWLFPKSSKQHRNADEEDGRINLRTNEKDFLKYTGLYFKELSNVSSFSFL
jgi:beta-galactosidase GanA